VHDVRLALDDLELALVVRQRDVDAAQVRRPLGILDDDQMLVGGLREQLLEDVVALDLGDAEQLWALPAVQLVERGRQVGLLRLEGLLGPALRGGELEVGRDRVVVGVEQVLQVPPRHADLAHCDLLDRMLRSVSLLERRPDEPIGCVEEAAGQPDGLEIVVRAR